MRIKIHVDLAVSLLFESLHFEVSPRRRMFPINLYSQNGTYSYIEINIPDSSNNMTMKQIYKNDYMKVLSELRKFRFQGVLPFGHSVKALLFGDYVFGSEDDFIREVFGRAKKGDYYLTNEKENVLFECDRLREKQLNENHVEYYYVGSGYPKTLFQKMTLFEAFELITIEINSLCEDV